MYHGTRKPFEVLRSGKLKPFGDAVYFTRSPEEAAYCANLLGNEAEDYTPALLVLNRSSLTQNYRLTPSRYAEHWCDEREEHVWDRTVSFRRHLLGVVLEADVAKMLGPPKFKYRDEILALPTAERAAYDQECRDAATKLREGRHHVRELIIRDRSQWPIQA
jgi:hypothetical protein